MKKVNKKHRADGRLNMQQVKRCEIWVSREVSYTVHTLLSTSSYVLGIH